MKVERIRKILMAIFMLMYLHLKRNTVVQVSLLLIFLFDTFMSLCLEVQDETIDRELEKQFNEGLQSKILHTHHEGLGFHGDECSTISSSDDSHHQQMKTKFVSAVTETKSPSLHNAVSKESEKVQDKSNNQKSTT
jgi:hypothetical protein